MQRWAYEHEGRDQGEVSLAKEHQRFQPVDFQKATRVAWSEGETQLTLDGQLLASRAVRKSSSVV